MKKFRLAICVLLAALTLGLVTPAAFALDDPGIDTTYAAVLLAEDGNQETVLYTKNENERLYPASLTKVMTVLLAVEDIEAGKIALTDPVTAQPGFDFDMIVGGSSVYIMQQETMTLESLLYCAMVASANDACNVIAQYVSGTISDFVERMNARAAEVGCTGTHFVNTHGLPDANHYTTAWDFSRILREAAKHELFMTIASAVNYTVPDTNVSSERKLESTNSLINPTNPLYPGDWGYQYAKGIKTGHTNDAGYCLASSAEKDGVQLLSVVLKADAFQQEDGSWYYGNFADTRTLFEWGFNNFSYQDVLRSTETVTEVPVAMGADAETVTARPSSSVRALLPNDVELSTVERTITLSPDVAANGLTAPVEAGQVVGEISVSRDGVVLGSSPLVTTTSVELSRMEYMKEQLRETLRTPGVILAFWTLVLLFALYMLVVVRYRSKRRAYQKRLEMARTVRLDMEDDEEELRHSRRVRATTGAAPRSRYREDVMLTPDSAVDEPTRVTGEQPAVTPDDEPTRAVPDTGKTEPKSDRDATRDYFEEFFGKK